VDARVGPAQDGIGINTSNALAPPAPYFPCRDDIPYARNVVVETPAAPNPVSAFAPEFARRLGLIFRALLDIISRHLLRQPDYVAMITPLWRRINRAVFRTERLTADLAAGRLPRPRPPRPSRAGRGDGGPHKPDPLPRERGWLIGLIGYQAAGCSSQLQALLADPEAAELLALLPGVGRLLRPIQRMLDINPRRRPSRVVPAPAIQYTPLPPALSTEWRRGLPAADPWHYHYAVLRRRTV
jgi:hypothetical protein